MQKFKSVDDLINQLKPEKPIYCIRKKSIQLASAYFRNKFPGKVLYAVKTNPHPEVLKTIIESGIEYFDIASIQEIKDIRAINPNAKVKFNLNYPDGTPRKLLNSQIMKNLGWKPKTSFENGLNKTYQWYIKKEKK